MKKKKQKKTASSSHSARARRLEREALLERITPQEMDRLAGFEEAEPFDVLGPHFFEPEETVVIRAYLPHAVQAWVRSRGAQRGLRKMQRIHDCGLFQTVFHDQAGLFDYRLVYEETDGTRQEREDPYAFLSDISDHDLYLIGEGKHFESYRKFGARVTRFGKTKGVHFAVWAPHARAVSIVGNFNHWQAGAHPMTRIHFSGIWGLFVPGLDEGEVYKFALRTEPDGEIRLKSDPYGFQAELRPSTASVVANLDGYRWKDAAWIKKRDAETPLDKPVSIYEVHLGSWRRGGEQGEEFLDYRTLARQLVEHAQENGYTHIELMPVMEHPLDESWGYQLVNYYAPTSRFGRPEEFMYLVDTCHQHGIGVILDWVPAHFPKDQHGLAAFDGTPLYAYDNWKKAEHREWGTLVFDYGKNEVRNFLISNALFWLDRYHIDGLRVDAVASMLYLDYSRNPGEWEPNCFGGNENLEAVEFLKQFNMIVHERYPGVITAAEESTAWPGVSRPVYLGGLGFTMKWNMGWMHDSLEFFSRDPVHRKYHQGMLTFSLLYAFSENFVLPLSHDEVVYGKRSLLEKMPGDEWQKFANVRLFLGWMFGHPGKKLNFMTNDIGQRQEWNCKQSMDWHLLHDERHASLLKFVRDLQQVYRMYRACHEVDFAPEGFEWIDCSDVDTGVLSFVRWSRDRRQMLLFTLNTTPVYRHEYRVGVPAPGIYREVLNSDALEYGGSGAGNEGRRDTEEDYWHGRPWSLRLVMAPLAVNVFAWGEAPPAAGKKKRKRTRK